MREVFFVERFFVCCFIVGCEKGILYGVGCGEGGCESWV